MGKRATIYLLNNNDNILEVIRKCNTNFKNLCEDNTITEIRNDETHITVHNDLTGRDSADCHPMGAIQDLISTLDAKADKSTLPTNYKRQLFDFLYPVTICIEIDSNLNPHDIFGYGTWQDITPAESGTIKKWKRVS